MPSFGFIFVVAMFAAIPALIVLFVVRKTTTENELRMFHSQTGDGHTGNPASGSLPHIFARTPTVFLLLISLVSGYAAWQGLSLLIGGDLEPHNIKAAGWGVVIFLVAIAALCIKHREIAAARRYATQHKDSVDDPNAR